MSCRLHPAARRRSQLGPCVHDTSAAVLAIREFMLGHTTSDFEIVSAASHHDG